MINIIKSLLREKKTSIITGTIYLTFATFFSAFIGYFIYFVLGRFLGPEKFGVYGVVIGLLTIITRVLLNSIQQSTSKFISENEKSAHNIKTKFLKITLIASLLVSSVYLLLSKQISLWLNDPGLVNYIRLTSFIIIPYSLYGVLQGYLNGLRFFRKQAVIRLVYSITRVFFIISLVLLGFGIWGAITGFLVAVFVSFALNYAIVGFSSRGKYAPNIKSISNFAVPIIVSTLIINTMMNISLLLVKAISPAAVSNLKAGYFTAATSIAQIPFIMLASFSIVVFPAISRNFFKKRFDKVKTYVKSSIRYNLMITVLICVLISSTSLRIIRLFYTSRYDYAALPLSILVFGFAFLAVFMLLVTIISGIGRQNVATIFSIIVLAGLISLSIYLIPLYSLVGAAFAMLAATVTGVIISSVYIIKKIKAFIGIASIIRIVISGAIIFYIGTLIQAEGIILILYYLTLSLIYFIILLVTGEFKRNDFELAKKTIIGHF